MIKVKNYYLQSAGIHRSLFPYCSFLDEKNNILERQSQILLYLSESMTSDLYLPERIQEHWKIIEKVEKDESATEFGGRQQFALKFHKGMVTLGHNEFEEEDGYPELSCPLSVFKIVLTAWEAFLKLPENIHSVVETEIPEWRK